MGAVLIDATSLPAEHDMSHVPPLCVSVMRPLTLDDADPMRVHVLVDDTLLSIHTICDTAEWMGQATQTSHAPSRWFVAPRYKNKCALTYSGCTSAKQLPRQIRLPHQNGGRAHKTGSS